MAREKETTGEEKEDPPTGAINISTVIDRKEWILQRERLTGMEEGMEEEDTPEEIEHLKKIGLWASELIFYFSEISKNF